MLHARRPARRAAGGRAARHPALHRELRARVRASTWSPRSWPTTARPARRSRACTATAISSSAGSSTGRAASTPTASPPATTHGSSGAPTARVAGGARHVLRRARDRGKDQSYFLFSLTQAQLARARFPLGELTKNEVRDYARAHGLAVADKPDSHEICFVADGDYAAFVERRAGEPPAPGPVKDTAGRVLGRHGGVHRFTVGQRKGLGLASPVRLYVTSLDAESRTVTVGPRHALERTTLTASRVNWISTPPAAGQRVGGADPAPAPGGAGARLAARRRACPTGVPRAAGRRRTGAGSRPLRRRRGPGRRLDRLRPDHTAARPASPVSAATESSAGRLSRYRSASIAAMHPEPAAVTAWR